MNALAQILAQRIAATGPITVADFMAAALSDPVYGYYRRNQPGGAGPLGARGDFVTAPEISQIFGELIGAWLIDCWQTLGRPNPINLVELGPGRGVLLKDALRIGRGVPGWLDAISLHLVEINPGLRAAQAARLGCYNPKWHDGLDTVPDGPVLLIGNEFLDALPIRQLVRRANAWHERLVDWSPDHGFYFGLSRQPSTLGLLVGQMHGPVAEGAIFELSPAVIAIVTQISKRIVDSGGAALLIDYGRNLSQSGETLQAIRAHRPVPVLVDPGEADLSAHVDFGLVRRVAIETGATVFGPGTQGAFLTELGIHRRAERLINAQSGDRAQEIGEAVARLTHADQMGTLFKALAIVPPDTLVVGFSAAS